MSFGFGVGDIIRVSQICWKTWQACTSGRKAAPGEFTEVEVEIFNLSTALDQLAAELASEAHQNNGVVVRHLSFEGPVSQCRKTLAELNTFLDKYRPSMATTRGTIDWTTRTRSNWRKIMWVTKKSTVDDFRKRIGNHVETLNILVAIQQRCVVFLRVSNTGLLTLARSAAKRLQEEVDEISKRLELSNCALGNLQGGQARLDVLADPAPVLPATSQDSGGFDRDATLRDLRLWLQPPEEVGEEYVIQTSRRWPATCQWITQKQMYSHWMSGNESSILWFHARPGAGKSVLASHLVSMCEDSDQLCAYLCFRYNNATLRSPQSLLRSLAFQMAEHDGRLCKGLARVYAQGSKVVDARTAVLWKKIFLDTLLKIDIQRRVYWIVDALDECDASERLPFLSFLADISRSSNCFKVIIFSRYSRDIATKLQQMPVPAEEITPDDNLFDVQLFARERIERSPTLINLKARILPQIVAESNGSFLWVSKTLDTLDMREGTDEILRALTELPPGMDELYKRIIHDMASNPPSQVALAKTVLKWVLCVSRPITVREVDYIVEKLHGSVADPKTMIKNSCGQLLNIDRNHRVQINHMTIQEFFQNQDMKHPFSVCFTEAHSELASFCLGYLMTLENLDEVSDEDLKESYPLADYASTFWSYHVLLSDSSGVLAEQIIEFLISPHFNNWLQTLALCSNLRYLEITLHNIIDWAGSLPESGLITCTEGLRSLCEQLGYADDKYHGARLGTMKTGFGTMQYANGDLYEGNWEGDLRHGFGEYIYADGAVYTGWWARDEYNGQGTLTSADGSEYIGNWEGGRKSGYGAMTWTWMERFSYQGDWRDDRPHGVGTMIFCFGTRYSGEWANGCEHGAGNMVYWNGNHFSGQFIDGDEVGEILKSETVQVEGYQNSQGPSRGVLKYASGGTYEGDIGPSGLPQGQGSWNAPTGYTWKGSFAEGMFDGPGVLQRLKGGSMSGVWHRQVASGKFEDINDKAGGGRYVGDFQDTTRHGMGVLESASGYVYEGNFSKNEMHGLGVRKYHNGDRYVGSSAHGSMHGTGLMIYASSAIYDGEWKNNKRHGSGILELSEGYRLIGLWSNNRAVGGYFDFS